MYTKRTNASPTSNLEKGSIPEKIRLDYEDTKQIDVSRSVCYGLTWTPSSDEKLSTNDASSRSLSPPQSLNTDRINDRRTRYSFSIPYELNRSENLPKADRERCLEIHKTLSTRTPATVAVSKDHDLYEYWLSGEKFFETPPKNYNEENDIPTRDKNDSEDVEEKPKEAKEHRRDDVALNLFELSSPRVYNSDKSLIGKIVNLKTTKETSDYGDAINKIRRSSSAFSSSHVERNMTKTNVPDPSSKSMVENVTSSHWNILERVSTLGRTNVHNHIYLSSGYLDRYFDVPISKILKLSRRNSRVRCIRRTILKKPKRSRSRLVGVACRINSVIEMESVNSSEGQIGRAFPKKNVCDVLTEIDTELSVYFKCMEKFREQLPSYISIETIFTKENKRTLNEIARRCKNYIRSSYNREEAVARMDYRLLNTLYDLLDLVKKVKRALLQEEQYYTKLQSVPILEKQDAQKINRLLDDAEWYLLNGFKSSSSYWKESACELLRNVASIMNEMRTIEDNKENIKKFINRKTNDPESTKKQLITKLDGKTNSAKCAKRYSVKKENQVDTQMGILSKAQPIVSIGKLKVSTKDLDGYRDRIKIKEIGDQRDKMLKENEYRVEKQSLAKPRKPIHPVWNNFANRVNTGTNLENQKVIKDRKNDNAVREKGSTMTSPTNTDLRRKRQSTCNAPLPVWKPGGAFKSVSGSISSVFNTEPPSRRTLNVGCDKENPDLMRSVPVKHANPSEPNASGKNILKENRKNENFREDRVTKLCKLLAQTKMQKGSKSGANVSETRSSTYTQSGLPLSDTSGTKIGVKSSQINLIRQSSGSKHRPGVHRFNNFPRNTRTSFETKVGTSSSKVNPNDKLECNDTPSDFSIQSNEKSKIENENVPSQQNLEESTFDIVKSAIILTNDKDKLQNTPSPKTTGNELVGSISNSNSTVNADYDLRSRSESQPSFVLLADVSCNAEFSSTSNSTMMVPSSKFCQVSLSSTSSRTSLNYDRSYDKEQSVNATPMIDKDSLEFSTDEESNYQTALGFDPRKQKNKHELSLNTLKDFLHDLGIDADVIQKVETKYQLKRNLSSMQQSNETSPSNLSKSFESPLIEASIETDSQSSKTREFKMDDIRSTESIESLNDSINVCIEKIDETIIERKKSKSSQTISNLKEFCDACTDAEDMKSDCSAYVDATVSCYELGLKTSFKDVCTEIFAEDKSILSPRRMVETQTNSHISPTDNVVKLIKEEEETQDNDLCMDTEDSKYEKPDYENEDVKSQHENNQGKSDCLLNSEDGITIDESPLSQCLIHQLEDIKEKLQNVDAQLNKLQEPAKETSDAFAQINTTTSVAPKSIGISTTSMTEISKESLEEFNIDFMKMRENCISSDIINAFYSIACYGINWNEALQIYRENSNTTRFEESKKDSMYSLSSDEEVNVSRKTTFTNASCQFVNEDFYSSCDDEKAKLGPEKSSCLFEKSSNVSNESKIADFSEESDETKSLSSFGFDDFYEEAMVKPISQKSSRSSVFFDLQDEIHKVQSSVDIKERSSAVMKHSERIQSSNENTAKQDVYDPEEFVLSREALLLLTYLTVCAFVFCCLKFSMTCESLIL